MFSLEYKPGVSRGGRVICPISSLTMSQAFLGNRFFSPNEERSSRAKHEHWYECPWEKLLFESIPFASLTYIDTTYHIMKGMKVRREWNGRVLGNQFSCLLRARVSSSIDPKPTHLFHSRQAELSSGLEL
jgi:hypothetical protein